MWFLSLFRLLRASNDFSLTDFTLNSHSLYVPFDNMLLFLHPQCSPCLSEVAVIPVLAPVSARVHFYFRVMSVCVRWRGPVAATDAERKRQLPVISRRKHTQPATAATKELVKYANLFQPFLKNPSTLLDKLSQGVCVISLANKWGQCQFNQSIVICRYTVLVSDFFFKHFLGLNNTTQSNRI